MKMILAAWALAQKDLRIYARDRAGLCLGFLVPMALVTVFGWIMTYAFSGSSGMPAVEIWVVDEDQTDETRKFIDSLRASESLKVRPRINATPATREYVRKLIADGEAHHAIIIPAGYTASLSDTKAEAVELLMIRDPGRSMEDQFIRIALMQSAMTSGKGDFWKRSMRRMFRERGMEIDGLERLDQAMTQMHTTIGDFWNTKSDADPLKDGAPPKEKEVPEDATSSAPTLQKANPMDFLGELISVETEDIVPPKRPKQVTFQQAQSISGMTVMMLLFGLTGAGSILLAEKEMGTLRRLFGMPIPRESILLGKFLFVATVGIAQMIVLFLYGELMFRVGMFRDPLTLAAIVVTWVCAATCFGMFITTFSRSAKQADSLSTICILTMAALGGCWFPLQLMNLPLPMEILCKSMMTYWAMEGLQGMLWNNLGLFDAKVLTALGIQWIWAGVLGALSIFFYRRNYCRDY